MTTIRQIITDGMREAGILPIDQTPEAAELTESLRVLKRLVKSLFGKELGDPLQSVNFGKEGLTNSYAVDEDVSSDINSAYVPANLRLMLNVSSAGTLYLDPNPADGARVGIIDNAGNLATYNVTLNGNGRQIELADTVVLSTNSLAREWFYRADLGNWARITDLDVDDPSPLPEEFDDLLITLLAIRINPRYGATTSRETTEVFSRIRSMFRARYSQKKEMPSELGIIALSRNSRYKYYNPNSFTRGR